MRDEFNSLRNSDYWHFPENILKLLQPGTNSTGRFYGPIINMLKTIVAGYQFHITLYGPNRIWYRNNTWELIRKTINHILGQYNMNRTLTWRLKFQTKYFVYCKFKRKSTFMWSCDFQGRIKFHEYKWYFLFTKCCARNHQ